MRPLLLIGVAISVAAFVLYKDPNSRRRGSDDRELARRVRAKLKRYVAHPSAVDVSVTRGCVVLAGTVAAHEHQDLVDAIALEPGVSDIYDRIEVFERVPGL